MQTKDQYQQIQILGISFCEGIPQTNEINWNNNKN